RAVETGRGRWSPTGLYLGCGVVDHVAQRCALVGVDRSPPLGFAAGHEVGHALDEVAEPHGLDLGRAAVARIQGFGLDLEIVGPDFTVHVVRVRARSSRSRRSSGAGARRTGPGTTRLDVTHRPAPQ